MAHLPGYRYVGPGTDVEAMDVEGGPVDEFDEAAREHDLSEEYKDVQAYVRWNDADERFLRRITPMKGVGPSVARGFMRTKRWIAPRMATPPTKRIKRVPFTPSPPLKAVNPERTVEYVYGDASSPVALRHKPSSGRRLFPSPPVRRWSLADHFRTLYRRRFPFRRFVWRKGKSYFVY